MLKSKIYDLLAITTVAVRTFYFMIRLLKSIFYFPAFSILFSISMRSGMRTRRCILCPVSVEWGKREELVGSRINVRKYERKFSKDNSPKICSSVEQKKWRCKTHQLCHKFTKETNCNRIAKIFIFLLLTDSPLLTAQHHSTLTLQSNYLAILARPLILLKSQSPLRHCVTAPWLCRWIRLHLLLAPWSL